MFAEIAPRSALNAEFAADAHGVYTVLHGQERELFIQLLTEHLSTTQQVSGFAREVRWRLRKLNYQAIKELFKELDQASQQFVTFLHSKVQVLNGALTQDFMPAVALHAAEHASGFRECFQEIHQLSQQLTGLVEQAQSFMNRAVDAGDYATANLVSEVLFRTNQLICKIKLDIPTGASFTSECRQPTRPNSYFSTMEVWAQSPGLMAITAAESYRF
jgi:DNA-binding ferritin-like protein